VTGTQPVQPVLACYQSATFNTSTCSWDVTGTQPVQPVLACYQSATFNTTTCSWDVTGTQPVQPVLACYQSATFNTTTCSWDVRGTQPVQPALACYQTATFNTTTCSWDVRGTQPVQPALACYQSATFNTTTCSWDVRGTQPVQPALACYQSATFNTTTCSWDVRGTQPVQPALACYQSATFNTTTCSWDVTGTQPIQPALACYQTATFNTTTCSWDVSGTQTQTNITGPTTICAGEQATFNAVVYSSTNVVAINWNCNNGNTASGSSFTVSFPQSGTFNVTMIATTSNGCVDTAVKQIIVKSLPTFTQPSDQNICSGTATLPVRFVSAINNTTFTWTNDNTSVGLVASGTGNIASFIALNNTSTTEYANIIVTATSQGCSYTAPVFTYIVNPIPVAIQPSNQTICNRAMTDPIFFNTFTSAVASNDYTWTNNQSSIGLAASGSGNIYAFMAQNNTNSPVTATITIVPTANGCVGAPANFTITVNPSPDVSQPIDQQVCNGQQIQAVAFNGTVAGTTFNWTNNNPSIGLAAYGNNTIQTFTAINNSNVRTIATITVTTIANGCTGNARTFEISVEPTPNLAQPSNIVACNGTIINPSDFIASVSGTSFNWLNSDSEIGIPANGVGDIPTFTATNSHNYPITATIVVVATANGCNNAQRTFTITINPSITIDSIPDQMICNGSRMNSINFTAPVSGTAISWSNDNTSIGLGANGSGSLAAFTAINNSAQNLIAHIIVSGSNANNCQASNRTFTIIVAPSPLISAGNDINVCRGTQANLTASGAVQFNWMPSASLSCLQCANPVTTATSNETYIVEGTNAMGCKSYDSVSVTVIQPFQMFVSPNDSLCAGKSIRLKAMNADQYSWSPAIGLNYTNIAEPIATPTSNITYQVIGHDAHHCFSDTGYVNIAVNQNPSVNAGADIEAAAGTTVTLHGNAQNGPITNWTWSPATNLSCADCPTPVLTVSNNTTYVVTVENTYGCKASDSVNIVTFCKNAQVFIPNAFTPDGDGSNDILMVRGTGISVKSFRIFNRWGNLVFEKQSFQPNDPKYGWDGKVKGVLATPDVYVYIAEVACDNGTPYLYKGNVTVLQ
jgi:gliding motility-associated-like protein